MTILPRDRIKQTDKAVPSKAEATKASVLASATLSVLKLVVGLLTGSLGLLAEAAHSLLDLFSTVITFFVIRVSAKPPDDNHPYGHEKAENLGALAGMTLLAATAVFILYHAGVKIFLNAGAPHVTIWSFVVLIISLVVDFLRSRSLKKTAVFHSSQALASDAEHFGNDMLGSLAVLVGLAIVAAAQVVSMPEWLVARADAFAAVLVAVIALHSVWKLGSAAVRSLMDDVPAGLVNRLRLRVEEVKGVIPGTVVLRPRYVGARAYVEVKVGMSRGTSLESAHQLSDQVEKAIATELGSGESTVHVEPLAILGESHAAAVRAIAQKLGLHIHNLNLHLVNCELCVELDLEVSDIYTVQEAHKYSEDLERSISLELPKGTRVEVHLEPRNDEALPAVRDIPSLERVRKIIAGMTAFNGATVRDALLTNEGLVVTLEQHFAGSMPLNEAHASMAGLERELRAVVPGLIRVHINPEIDDTPSDRPARVEVAEPTQPSL